MSMQKYVVQQLNTDNYLNNANATSFNQADFTPLGTSTVEYDTLAAAQANAAQIGPGTGGVPRPH